MTTEKSMTPRSGTDTAHDPTLTPSRPNHSMLTELTKNGPTLLEVDPMLTKELEVKRLKLSADRRRRQITLDMELLNRARTIIADKNIDCGPVCDEVRQAGKRQLEYWRKITFCDVHSKEFPVMRPDDMIARINQYLDNRELAPTKNEERYLQVLEAAQQAGWANIGMPEVSAATKSMFYTSRSHILREAKECIKECLESLQIQNFSDMVSGIDESLTMSSSQLNNIRTQYLRWRGSVDLIHDALLVIDRYPPDAKGLRFHDQGTWRRGLWQDMSQLLKDNNIKPASKSTGKKRMLKKLGKLDGSWREKIWSEAKGRSYARVIAALLVTGARPIELCQTSERDGVRFSLDESGHLCAMIIGAKTHTNPDDLRKDKGQPERYLTFRTDSDPARFLADQIRDNDGQPIIVAYETSSKRPARALSVVLERLAAKVLPLGPNEKITGYVIRNAFSADVKASLLDTITDERDSLSQARKEKRRVELMAGLRTSERSKETLSEITRPDVLSTASIALGQTSIRTQSKYGGASQSSPRSKGATLIKALGTKPVRGSAGPKPTLTQSIGKK